MAPVIKRLIQAGIRILLFHGDADLLCNFMMGEEFAAELGLPV